MMLTIRDFTNIKSPAYSCADNTTIDIIADIAEVGDAVPFTAVRDAEGYAGELYKLLESSKFGRVATYVQDKGDFIANAESKKQFLLFRAGHKIAPLEDAVDLGMATEEEKSWLKIWKEYRILLNRVDVSKYENINWPEKPDDEY